MKAPSSNSKCLYTIELTRGIAALVIFALHIILFGHRKYGVDFSSLMDNSINLSIGIDIFFLISGFLMLHTTRQPAQRSAREFLLKRFIRIYPAYWLVLAFIIPVFYFKPEWAFAEAQVKPSILLSILLLPQEGPPALNVAWSLVYEVYFYLLFAITLFMKPRWQVVTLGLFFTLSVFAGRALDFQDPVLDFLTSDYLLEFFAGILLACIWPLFPKIRFLPVFCFAGAAAFIVMHPFPGIARMITFGIPALLIFIAMLSIEKNRLFMPDRIAHFFGRISYALYLIHVPVLTGLPKITAYFDIAVPKELLLILAAILGFAGAVLLHYVFELPIQKWIKRKLVERKIALKTCAVEEY